MKKTVLKLTEKAIRNVSTNSIDGKSVHLCYEAKMSDDLKAAILNKKNEKRD